MIKGLKTKLNFTFNIDSSINESDMDYNISLKIKPLKPKINIKIKNKKSNNTKLF